MLEGVYEVKGQIYHCTVGLPAREVAERKVLREDVVLRREEVVRVREEREKLS